MADRAKKTTWKDVELFLMEWRAELRCQIEENQQRRDESMQRNVIDSRRSQPNSDSNAIPRNAVPARVVPGSSSTEGSRDLSGRSSQSDGEVLSLSEASGSRLQSMDENLKRMKALVLQSQQMAASFRSTSSRSFNFEGEQQPIDLISDSPANPPNFQSIEEPIEGVLESPESICDSRETSRHSTKVSTAPAISIVLGTPNDADRLSGAGMTEGNRGNRILGGRRLERENLVFPSYGPVEPDPTSFPSENSELLSLKVEENQSSVPSEVHRDSKEEDYSWISKCRRGNDQTPELEIVAVDVRLKWDVDGRRNSMESLEFLNAYKVFEKMPSRKNGLSKPWVVTAKLILVYDGARTLYVELPNTFGDVFGSIDSSSSFVFDPGKQFEFSLHTTRLESWIILPFDPGGDQVLLIFWATEFLLPYSY